ncbi:MAG TPA: hypothetical protein VFP72_24785 [Kineosporiaceae bacterium]|nr:hypothetical protein [Kineosporiaceae bacterium]
MKLSAVQFVLATERLPAHQDREAAHRDLIACEVLQGGRSCALNHATASGPLPLPFPVGLTLWPGQD